MKQLVTILITAFATMLVACGQAPVKKAPKKDIRIILKTDKGDVEATLYASKAPITCANFLNLAKRGYYNGIHFHRVIPRFMVQGGDPTETGTGGPGYQFNDEIHPELKHKHAGIFSMANAGVRNGNGTNGSQFFITHKPTPHLDGRHTVFGQVTKGLDIVNSITGKLSGPGWKTDGIGSKILSIKILDSTDELFELQKDQLVIWNKVLDKKFPIKK